MIASRRCTRPTPSRWIHTPSPVGPARREHGRPCARARRDRPARRGRTSPPKPHTVRLPTAARAPSVRLRRSRAAPPSAREGRVGSRASSRSCSGSPRRAARSLRAGAPAGRLEQRRDGGELGRAAQRGGVRRAGRDELVDPLAQRAPAVPARDRGARPRRRRARRGSGSRRAPRARRRAASAASPPVASSRTRHCTSATSAAVSLEPRLRVHDRGSRSSRARAAAATSHHRNVGSGNAPQRSRQVDRLDVVGVVAERARDAGARERAEQRHPRRGQPGVAALPERRVGRQRERGRAGAPAAGSSARSGGLRVGTRDVDVQARTSARGARARASSRRANW